MRTKHTIVIGDSRNMTEVEDASVHLVVTSPPYWQLKDYGAKGQIGYQDSYQEYIDNLNQVWNECYRVLHPGCRLCVNIGDQFARAVFYGRYKVIPIRTEITKYCESIGFDYMGAIIWQKATTCQTTGGATVMGSYPYPRGGIVKIDYEFILLFKKLGKEPKVIREIKEKSRLTNEEWNTFFNGHWNFPGERQNGHIAMFPKELPRRLIKMFSFYCDTVLDPFLGSGTTSLAALELDRNSIGYEINPEYLESIKSKLGLPKDPSLFIKDFDFEIINGKAPRIGSKGSTPLPSGNNHLERLVDPKAFKFGTVLDNSGRRSRNDTFRVAAISKANEVILDSGLTIRLLGVIPSEDEKYREGAVSYLRKLLNGNRVFLKYDANKFDRGKTLQAYVYLENKTFLNAKLIRNGLGRCDTSSDYHYRRRFERYEEEARKTKVGFWGKEK